MCFQGRKPGTFTIETIEDEAGTKCKIDAAEAEEIITKLNGQNFQKRIISVTMAQLSTPEKSKKKPVVVILNSSNDDSVSQPTEGQLALPAPEGLPAEPQKESAPANPQQGAGVDAELPKNSEAEKANMETDELPGTPTDETAKEALKLRILREVTETGTVTNRTERVIGDKSKRMDTSGSSLDGSPELTKPSKKKVNNGGGGGKSAKNTKKK